VSIITKAFAQTSLTSILKLYNLRGHEYVSIRRINSRKDITSKNSERSTMFCCLGDWGSSGSNKGTSFPGQRRGNALSGLSLGNIQPEIVSVVVPQGLCSGDMITVQSPTSGRTTQVMIPSGIGPQGTFTVEFPPASQDDDVRKNNCFQPQSPISIPVIDADSVTIPVATKVDGNNKIESNPPISSVTVVESRQDVNNSQQEKPVILVQVPPGTAPGSTLHVQVPGEDRILAAQVPPGVSEFHVAYEPGHPEMTPAPLCSPSLVHAFDPTPTSPVASVTDNNQKQSLMLVKVPPGVSPGTTIQVQIPGENRMVSAQVPHGVSEFHVAYEPQQRNSLATGQNQNSTNRFVINGNQRLNNNQHGFGGGMGSRIQQLEMGTGQNYNDGYGRNNNQGYSNNNTNQGCNNSNNNQGYIINNSNQGYNNNNNNNQGYSNSNNQRFNNNNQGFNNNNQAFNNNNQGYNNNGRGGSGAMGSVAPILAGAALMGGAGYMIHQHNQHINENNGDEADYNDNGGGYDDGGGNGGGYDYGANGGGYDDGGNGGGYDDGGVVGGYDVGGGGYDERGGDGGFDDGGGGGDY